MANTIPQTGSSPAIKLAAMVVIDRSPEMNIVCAAAVQARQSVSGNPKACPLDAGDHQEADRTNHHPGERDCW